MGLVVWLPLNGNLENQGVSAVTATNNGAIVNTAGKIGSCYSFDGTDDFLTLNNFNPNGWPEISISAWVYPTAAFDHLFLFRGSGAHRFKINSSGVVFRDTNNSTQRNVALGQTISTNVWTHITCVYKCGEIWIYQNGIQTAHNSTYYNATSTLLNDLNEYRIARVQSSSGNGYYTGKINDFRIYDHALSAAEVHEISQGLVLHYKFDDLPQNYTKNTNTSWTNFTIGQWYTTIFSYSMSDFIAATGAQNGDKFTWSIDINGIGGTKNLSARVQHYNNGSDRTSVIGNAIPAGEEGRSFVTFTLNTSYAQLDFMITNSSSGTVTNNTTEQYKNTKIQYGDVATGWVPKGMTQTITDSSGYSNYGIPNGTLILNSNTARYHASTFFNGTNSVISAPSVSTIKAYSFWLKLSNLTVGKCIFADTLSHLAFALSTSNYITVASYTNATYKQTYTLNNLTANQWQHVIVQWNSDSSDVELYINGVAATKNGTTQNMYQQDTTAQLTIGARKLNGIFNNFSSCSISDFRAYTTHLSTDDIKQLYEVGAKVDNKQNLHTYEIQETNNNLFAGKLWSNNYTTRNPINGPFTNFNSNGEYQFTANGTSAGSEYIVINPTGHTYEYDYTISVNTGNHFYIGFERYDANKTSRSNQACVYTTDIKPSSDLVKQHYHGTVNLSTDTVNPCKYICLRILNGWSGTTSGVTGKATIHSFSLREVSSIQQPKLKKTGIFIEEELKEETATKLHKNGIVETNNLIEL